MECTRETDGRKNDSLTQEYIRNQVVKAIKAGRHPRDVAEIFGISERHVYRILAAYFSGGKNALLTKKSTGRPCKLSVDEIQWLEQAIREQTPCQFKFEFALWTLRTVQQLIRDRFDKELSISATRQLLHSLGFTPQKPRLKAWQQDDALVQQWHQQDFPHIQQQAKAVGASLYFADEAGIRSTDRLGRTCAPAGETPVLQGSGTRFGINMLSAIGSRGECEFMICDGRMNAGIFLDFLKRLMTGKSKPVYLIFDGQPIHRAKIVEEYVASTQGMLRLFYLPGYPPKLNPDEQVWAHVKREVTAKINFLIFPTPRMPADYLRTFLNDKLFWYISNFKNVTVSAMGKKLIFLFFLSHFSMALGGDAIIKHRVIAKSANTPKVGVELYPTEIVEVIEKKDRFSIIKRKDEGLRYLIDIPVRHEHYAAGKIEISNSALVTLGEFRRIAKWGGVKKLEMHEKIDSEETCTISELGIAKCVDSGNANSPLGERKYKMLRYRELIVFAEISKSMQEISSISQDEIFLEVKPGKLCHLASINDDECSEFIWKNAKPVIFFHK
ncbi:IS630 family transposase [Parachitinimonas caeni]|uniref:IS630 family transposase n=1 Tax=Parachitinimonas caeni TaxID=3031301 RepID=A0ABT7E3R8_9NEIS|nr:IS630 family transposase [Parachitinimonas caeni]MDK2126967.1 IS630 family transposase [Parachitinimonas caeni]